MNSIEEAQDVRLTGRPRPEDPFDVAVVRGPSFERLMEAIGDRIEQVAVKDGQLEVSLRGDIAWDSGVVSGSGKVDKDKAGLMLVARAATYAAARQRLSKDTDLETVIATRDLDTASTWFTNRHPWFNNLEAKLGLRPVSLREALQQEPEKLVETLSSKQKTRRPLLAPSLATLAAAATACELAQPSPPAVVQTIEDPATATAMPEATATSFVATGPEATPVAAVAYPTRLGAAEVSELMIGAGGSLPEGFLENAEVQALVETRRSWLRQKGFNVDNPDGANYVQPVIHAWGAGESFRWDVIPEDSAGNIVGWLEIADPNIQTGFRFAEGPSWDSNFNPQENNFRFGLPQKLAPGNHFEVVLVGGEYRILVEIDTSGKPLRWLNVTQQEMETLEGAVIATPTPEFGGEQVGEAFYYSDSGGHHVVDVPPELQQYLVPVSAEEWTSRERLIDTEGTPLPYGVVFRMRGAPNTWAKVITGYLSAVVWYEKGEDLNFPGEKVYFAIVQFPATGGTNTVFYQLNEGDRNASSLFATLPEGLPAEWVGRQIDSDEIYTRLPPETRTIISDRKLIPILQQYVGRPVLVQFTYVREPGELLNTLIQRQLIPKGLNFIFGLSGILVPSPTS